MTVTDISSVAITAAFLSLIIVFRGVSEEAAYIKYAKCCHLVRVPQYWKLYCPLTID